MNQNIDLLKSHIHSQTQTFLENTLNANLIPTIMRPTRITKSSSTLIDNIYISNQLNYKFDSCILLSDISDHMPTFTIIWQNKSKKIGPVEFKTCNLKENKTKQLVAEQEKINWSDRIQFNVPQSGRDQYNKFNAIIVNSTDIVAPEHTVHISAKNRFAEPWVTQGLIKTSKEKLGLYKLHLSTDVADEVHRKYISYRNKIQQIKACTQIELLQLKMYTIQK